jgi:hypothetical protein
MTKTSIRSVALAVAFAAGIPLSGAVAEQGQDPRQAYNQALNDCAQLDNPDRRQLCEQKAKEQFEQAQKSGAESGDMEKQERKQY